MESNILICSLRLLSWSTRKISSQKYTERGIIRKNIIINLAIMCMNKVNKQIDI